MDLIYNHNYQKSNAQFQNVTMVLKKIGGKNQIIHKYPVFHPTPRPQIIIIFQKMNAFFNFEIIFFSTHTGILGVISMFIFHDETHILTLFSN
jgi:hypothetical protein